jgi:hypothetical protein
MSFNFTNLISALTTAGVSPATIATTVQSLGVASWSTQATAKLHQIAAVSGNPVEVAKLALEMKEIPGLQSTVATATDTLATPGLTQFQIVELIPAVEAAINAQ